MDLREQIKSKLKEMDNKITKISVFDFDGTLVDTPLPDEGKIKYKEKTGTDWPHRGWWGKPESLDMDIFDMPEISEVISAYHEEKAKSGVLVVMMTGRVPQLSKYVEHILKSKNLSFDKYIYNNGGSTDQSKIKSLESMLKEYPSVESVEMWDDRLTHIPIFNQWGENQLKSGRLKDFNINVVKGNHH